MSGIAKVEWHIADTGLLRSGEVEFVILRREDGEVAIQFPKRFLTDILTILLLQPKLEEVDVHRIKQLSR